MRDTLQGIVETAIDNLRASNQVDVIYYRTVQSVWVANLGATPKDKSNILVAIATACANKG